MKKAIIGVAVVLIVAIVVLAKTDFNRLGKDNVYVQVPEQVEVEETKLDSGEIMKRYVYKVPAYTADGEAVNVEFSAHKALRVDAYLMLYMKNGDQVTSYDEVAEQDVPQKALEKLNGK